MLRDQDVLLTNKYKKVEKLEVKFEGDAPREIIWREGEAVTPLPLKEPNKISITGDIKTVGNYLAVRKDKAHSLQVVDASKAIVEVDKQAGTIKLLLDPENHYGATVLGKMEIEPELAAFCINKNKIWKRKELLDFIKFQPMHFSERSIYTAVVQALTHMKVKTAAEMESNNDNRGNRTQTSNRAVVDDNGFPKTFVLEMPVYKGGDKSKFTVDMLYEPGDTDVVLWLESVELKEALDAQMEAVLKKELAHCEGLVIVHK